MHAVKLLHPKHWAALFFFTFGLFVQSFMFYRFQMVLFPGQKLPALTGYRHVIKLRVTTQKFVISREQAGNF